jgi:hypothetical protein
MIVIQLSVSAIHSLSVPYITGCSVNCVIFITEHFISQVEARHPTDILFFVYSIKMEDVFGEDFL